MINIAIADDNIMYGRGLMNAIHEKIRNVKVYNISINGDEVLEYLKQNIKKIDILLLDLKMPKCNGIEVIKELEKNIDKKYRDDLIIVISGEPEMMIKLTNNPLIYTVISKTCPMSGIIERIKKLVENKQKEKYSKWIESKIREEVKYLDFNLSYKGTQYMIDTIQYILENDNGKIENLKQDIFPILAKRYHTSIHNIKCNINTATKMMSLKCEKNKLEKYIGFVYDTKPTSKYIIYAIINHIKR